MKRRELLIAMSLLVVSAAGCQTVDSIAHNAAGLGTWIAKGIYDDQLDAQETDRILSGHEKGTGRNGTVVVLS